MTKEKVLRTYEVARSLAVEYAQRNAPPTQIAYALGACALVISWSAWENWIDQETIKTLQTDLTFLEEAFQLEEFV